MAKVNTLMQMATHMKGTLKTAKSMATAYTSLLFFTILLKNERTPSKSSHRTFKISTLITLLTRVYSSNKKVMSMKGTIKTIKSMAKVHVSLLMVISILGTIKTTK